MEISKTYPKERSPLYRLRRKRDLAALLGVPVRDFKALSLDSNYTVFPKVERGKTRMIQHPTGELERIHGKLQILLQRIQTPEYLRSGKKGMSSIDNARSHLGRNYLLAMDVEHFFPSCKAKRVYEFFRYEMQMDPDVARLLSDIVTYEGHVPTGSSLSMSMAYWACSKAFDRVYELAWSEGMEFTLYVDDMTFSFPSPIAETLHSSINHVLGRAGLRLKRKKTRYLPPEQYKVITGVALSPSGELRVPNRHRLKILRQLQESGDFSKASPKKLESLQGILVSDRQIEPDFFETTFRRVQKAIRAHKSIRR